MLQNAGAALPPGHLHAEGGDDDDSDGSDGSEDGSDGDDGGSEDEGGGPPEAAAAAAAGDGGGGDGMLEPALGPALQAQSAAIDLSMQHLLNAAALMEEHRYAWGSPQLGDQLANAGAQIAGTCQQLHALFQQAAAVGPNEVSTTAFVQ